MMVICLSLMLSVDLILMVRNPFDRKESRMPIYYGVSLLISLTSACFLIGNVFNTDVVNKLMSGFFLTILSAYIIISVFSVVYTCQKLSGPGISKEVRTLILKRHILTIVVYLVSNLYSIIFVVMMAKDDWANHTYQLDYWYVNMLKLIYGCQGFFIPISRLSEPYFY